MKSGIISLKDIIDPVGLSDVDMIPDGIMRFDAFKDIGFPPCSEMEVL
jgi:hypothetical protein